MLDILSIAPTWSDVIVVDNKPYYHISRNKIVDELKALDLKADTVYRYLKELTENGFILYIKKDGKDLITFTQKAKNLFRENHSEKNPNSYENSENFPNKLGKKSENHSEKNPTYKYTRINKNTNIKERESNSNSTNANFEEEKNIPHSLPDLDFDYSVNDGIVPSNLIKYYEKNISSKREDIQEQASFNQIMMRLKDIKKIFIGLTNYKKALELSNKKPMKLFFFIRDGIYLDYQKEQVIELGKNQALVPDDLVNKCFVVDGETIKFLKDGYLKIEKDHKVTNAKNVADMVNTIRTALGGER
jgi:Fe2+ or Zn2+ uptake regulation protein